MVGEVTSSTALVQVRLTESNELVNGDVPGKAGVVAFELFSVDSSANRKSIGKLTVEAVADNDFIARAAFQDLQPGAHYHCETQIGETPDSLVPGPQADFQTLPGPDRTDEVTFVVVTGMNYAKFHGDDRIDREQHLIENNTELAPPYDGPDKHLGYPALETIAKMQPNFFVGTGDNVYYDTPDKFRAQTITELRQKWHEQFVQPRYLDLFAKVPTYWEIDDHDYRIDDCDNTGDYDPTPAVGRQMMLEQLPVAAAGDSQAKTYRTHRVNRDLQVWFTENRMYRSPNAMEDGPQKTIWGAEQKAWLQQTLLESDATFKILISPTPMIGPDDLRKTDNHTNIGGFRYERDEFFAWLVKKKIPFDRFFVVCGDRHWQYHSTYPAGVQEFSCGALIDTNSRPARKPGDPAGTDPDGLISQTGYQPEPSGGFLVVNVARTAEPPTAVLKFRLADEKGVEHYAYTAKAPLE